MNKERRKQIVEMQNQLDDLKSQLETVRDEEQEYLDNI